MDLTSALLLALLVAILLALLLPRKESEREKPLEQALTTALEDRVARHVAGLEEGGQQAEDAERRLLSMGPRVIPALLSHLACVDIQPSALNPSQQLQVEGVLADFGPQTFLQTRRFLRRVHRVSPVFPALVRILRRIGPSVLIDLAQASDEVPFILLASVTNTLRLEVDDDQLALAVASDGNADLMLIAILPALVTSPNLESAVRKRLGKDEHRLDDLYARVGLSEHGDPTPAPTSLGLVADASLMVEDFRARLAEKDGQKHDDAALEIIRLAAHLDDPRVTELFIELAERHQPNTDVAALALRELSRANYRSLQPLLNRLLRAPELSRRAMAHLRSATRLSPGPTVQALSLALRSETPRVVLRAVDVLTVLDIRENLSSFLKALGRHRYSPLEAHLAAPVLARWRELAPDVMRLAASEDREIQLSSVELLGCYGKSENATDLLALWGKNEAASDVILNAVELLGLDAVPALENRLNSDPAPVDSHLLARRLQLLRLLATR